ncbi:hypothetical protein [Rhodopila sp.]|uniref:hypothetical protein n=1 Tax=Rhodopila sp. TaxID=2480087 RepID=UPI003D119983
MAGERKYPDAFALKNTGLDAFLYADVGTELNGSPLTILSVLARLGNDPWAQAAGWAGLPRAAAIDGLSQSIAQMPLTPTALTGSRDIAARLVQLLPGKARPDIPARAEGAKPVAATPNWLPVTMIWWGVAVWMVLSGLLTPKPSTNVIAPVSQPVAISGPTSSAPVPLPQHTAAAPPTAAGLP